jgi:hypothetical protein
MKASDFVLLLATLTRYATMLKISYCKFQSISELGDKKPVTNSVERCGVLRSVQAGENPRNRCILIRRRVIDVHDFVYSGPGWFSSGHESG